MVLGALTAWPTMAVLLDFITILTPYRIGLDRFLQVDIDDVFVGKHATTKDDVLATVQFQKKWRDCAIPNFKLYTGFSGGYYKKPRGVSGLISDEEILGDVEWINKKDEFFWFGHMYKHNETHRYNTSKKLCDYGRWSNILFSPSNDVAIINRFDTSLQYENKCRIFKDI